MRGRNAQMIHRYFPTYRSPKAVYQDVLNERMQRDSLWLDIGCGNAGLVGWQLIGYPGPYMSWAKEIDQHFGKAFRPKPKSLEDVLGRKTTPWEDDK